jgi:protein-disulfide isomerase
MVEFTDYECPFCRQFETGTLREIRKNFIDTGKLRLIVRSMPLPMRKHAIIAAQAALCAGDQGQFWGMHDALFVGAAKLESEATMQTARALPLDALRFKSCLEGGKHVPTVLKEMQDASALQLNGTLHS